jgi:hypothetical protein
MGSLNDLCIHRDRLREATLFYNKVYIKVLAEAFLRDTFTHILLK